MVVCTKCGGRMRRIHRTFWQKFGYLAIYQCGQCHAQEPILRSFRYHFGPYCRCPECGDFRMSRLKQRDRIDQMRGGGLNFLKRLAGGKLHHCRYCRMQFYDRRPLSPEALATHPQPEAHEPTG